MTEEIAGRLGLAPRHMLIVTSLLAEYVPDRPVWAFGSRAFGRARRFSDLDLAVGGTGRLSAAQHWNLRDALDESLLPVEVDVVDLNDVDDSFRSRIEPDFLLVQASSEAQD